MDSLSIGEFTAGKEGKSVSVAEKEYTGMLIILPLSLPTTPPYPYPYPMSFD